MAGTASLDIHWKIVPGYEGEGVAKEMPYKDELKKLRARRVARAEAGGHERKEE